MLNLSDIFLSVNLDLSKSKRNCFTSEAAEICILFGHINFVPDGIACTLLLLPKLHGHISYFCWKCSWKKNIDLLYTYNFTNSCELDFKHVSYYIILYINVSLCCVILESWNFLRFFNIFLLCDIQCCCGFLKITNKWWELNHFWKLMLRYEVHG